MKRSIFALGFMLLCASGLRGQASRVDDIAIANFGGNLRTPGAVTITVCTSLAGGLPCSPKATIYTDATAGTTAANPFLADADGNYGFWAVPGTYVLTITGAIPSGFTKIYTVGPGLTTNNGFTGANTFSNINGALVVGSAIGQYASMQAAHDALPAAGGTVFVMGNATPFGASGTTALTISKPVHLIIDSTNVTYSGSATQAILCSSGTRGVIIEGAGRRGDDVGTSGTTINVTNTATNGISNVCNGATYRDFNLLGPGSGTGKGIINTAGRANYERLNISSWGSDGWTNDGSAANSNTVEVMKVRSSANGGNGFVTKGSNGQLVSFISTDGSANTGDGYNISNQLNMFFATNADGAGTTVGYHFVAGGSNNTGSLDPDSNGTVLFDVGANNNTLFAVAPSTQITDNGSLNVVYSVNSSTWLTSQQTWKSGDRDGNFVLNAGTGGAIRGFNINFRENAVAKWAMGMSNLNEFLITNAGVLNRFRLNAGGITDISSEGVNAVRINSDSGGTAGTTGLEVWSGGGAPAKIASITPTGTAGQLTLVGTTVASLPSAASNPGAILTVTDSTTISAEGQTCTGGSNVKALAFSNGAQWKCF
jgi:hypothetical protein